MLKHFSNIWTENCFSAANFGIRSVSKWKLQPTGLRDSSANATHSHPSRVSFKDTWKYLASDKHDATLVECMAHLGSLSFRRGQTNFIEIWIVICSRTEHYLLELPSLTCLDLNKRHKRLCAPDDLSMLHSLSVWRKWYETGVAYTRPRD